MRVTTTNRRTPGFASWFSVVASASAWVVHWPGGVRAVSLACLPLSFALLALYWWRTAVQWRRTVEVDLRAALDALMRQENKHLLRLDKPEEKKASDVLQDVVDELKG